MWQPRILEYLQLYTILYLGWLTASLVFKSQERDDIVVQVWKLHGILPTEKIPGPNFLSNQ